MDFIEISVIVPVYNVEKYLCQCVESILSQTYRNFELLLIDDGSKDNSGNICDEYAKNDPRIRVLHVENGGASYARNIGLNIAVGDWVTFVDADDWVSSNYLEELVKDVDSDDMLILYPPVKVIDVNQFKAEVMILISAQMRGSACLLNMDFCHLVNLIQSYFLYLLLGNMI